MSTPSAPEDPIVEEDQHAFHAIRRSRCFSRIACSHSNHDHQRCRQSCQAHDCEITQYLFAERVDIMRERNSVSHHLSRKRRFLSLFNLRHRCSLSPAASLLDNARSMTRREYAACCSKWTAALGVTAFCRRLSSCSGVARRHERGASKSVRLLARKCGLVHDAGFFAPKTRKTFLSRRFPVACVDVVARNDCQAANRA